MGGNRVVAGKHSPSREPPAGIGSVSSRGRNRDPGVGAGQAVGRADSRPTSSFAGPARSSRLPRSESRRQGLGPGVIAAADTDTWKRYLSVGARPPVIETQN